MASEFDYQLTERAEADLDGIVSYIAAQLGNPQAAAGFLDRLQAAIQEACACPESGALVVNAFLPSKTVRKKLVGNYILYYLPEKQKKMLYILRILYGSRNLEEILSEMKPF